METIAMNSRIVILNAGAHFNATSLIFFTNEF
jgi:hypothetical protein